MSEVELEISKEVRNILQKLTPAGCKININGSHNIACELFCSGTDLETYTFHKFTPKK